MSGNKNHSQRGGERERESSGMMSGYRNQWQGEGERSGTMSGNRKKWQRERTGGQCR